MVGNDEDSVVVPNVADDEAVVDCVGACVFATSTVVPKDDDRLPRKATRVMRDVNIMMCLRREDFLSIFGLSLSD